MAKIMEIVKADVHGVLDEYLCGELLRDIEKEIVDDIQTDLKKHEPDLIAAETDFKDCVNELCLRCGKYHDEYKGACDGCRWLKLRRGW